MSITLYPSVAKVKRNGVYENLPGFVDQSAENAAQEMIAIEETSTTAQFEHFKNTFFRLNDTLYQVDEYIPVNGTIAIGTNCHVAILGDNVTALENGLEEKIHYDNVVLNNLPIESQLDCRNWEQGTINYNTGINGTGTPPNNRLRIKGTLNINTTYFAKIYANAGYLFSVLVYDANNTFIGTLNDKGVIAPGTDLKWFSEFIPINAEHFYKFVVRKTDGTANITPLDGYNNITIIQSAYTRNVRDNIFFDEEEVEPVYEIQGQIYNFSSKKFINATNGIYKHYRIEKGCNYYLTTEINNSTKVAFIQWFDGSNTYISASASTSASKPCPFEHYITDMIPQNARYMGINFCSADPFKTYSLKKVSPVKQKKELSILFIGNSLIQDGVAYLPYMLKTYYPEIKFNIHIFYNGGYTLAQQYTDFQNDEPCDIYSIADDNSAWTNFTNATKMSGVLQRFKFDIICLQEYFNYKESYSVSDLADFNNCRDYITSHYAFDNALEFISFFHAPLRTDADNVYDLTEDGNALILQKTIAQDMIPAGMAIYNAMSTSLDSLGDASHLSNDGTHAQEGLPCLLETFTILCWLLDKLAINKSIYGSKMRMTSEIYNTLNVPGSNLGTGLITGTDAENLLAQEVAIQSYKQGKQFVMNNIYSST